MSFLDRHIRHCLGPVLEGSRLEVGQELGKVEQTCRYVLLGETAFLFDVENTEICVRVFQKEGRASHSSMEMGVVEGIITETNLRQIRGRCPRKKAVWSSKALKR